MAEKGKLSSGEKKKKAVSEYEKMATDPNKGFYFSFLNGLFLLKILGQNGPIPPFLEIFSKKTLFRK